MMATRSSILGRFLLAGLLICFQVTSIESRGQSGKDSSSVRQISSQRSFTTPQKAAEALIKAAQDYDVPDLLSIFGPDAKSLFSSADPVHDKNNALAFARKAQEKNTVIIDERNRNKAILVVGGDDWPLPVPIVKKYGKWLFDTKAGRKEILNRRIGANELDAIQICHGFVEAQHEYASEIHDNSGINQYAQKIISSPGKQDGLYWQNLEGTPGGPISEVVASAIQEGYAIDKKSAYHGYYYKVLKGQGPAAPLGRIDYLIKGIMIGGFALLAVPAEYGVTGIKSFIVSNDGIVYEKDLGPNSVNIGKSTELYNPDKTWRRTYDTWPSTDSNELAEGKNP